MARITWTEPTLSDLQAIAEYVALDKPSAASRLVQNVFERTGGLEEYPLSGKRPAELKGTHYRELVFTPCRIICRVDGASVFVVHVIRFEKMLREYILRSRDE